MLNASKRFPSIRMLSIFLILISVFFLSGCGQSGTVTQPAPDKTTVALNGQSTQNKDISNPSSSEHPVKLQLYFPTPDAEGLVLVERTVNITDAAVIKTMFMELQNPPTGLDKPIPEGTKLLSAEVKDGVAVLNLSNEFKKNFNGGSAGEQMILYSIVDTLTTLPNVQSVQFLLEGQKQDAILGNTDTTKPLKRNQSLIRK